MSPLQTDRGYVGRNPNDKYNKSVFTKGSLRNQQASRARSPQRDEFRGRDDRRGGGDYKRHRSLSPLAGDGYYSRKTTPNKQVNFKMPSAQSVTDNYQEENRRDRDYDDGVDPDLREEIEDRDRAVATWTNRSVDNANMSETEEPTRQDTVNELALLMGCKVPDKDEVAKSFRQWKFVKAKDRVKQVELDSYARLQPTWSRERAIEAIASE